jgi:divalent metal cation (Fe/Co/Zn/Cd) transporter
MKDEITADRTLQIKRVTWVGLFLNVALAALKFIVGFAGASQAVIADAVHSLSDMATDFSVILGVRYWTAPPDEDHPRRARAGL